MFNKVKGFRDIFGADITYWQSVEKTLRNIFSVYGYNEIKLPILEKTELFVRGIGDTTDIVEKEMFTFTDRDGTLVSLRPEGTASVVRCFIENKLYNPPAIKKYFYFGPMFRRERPQKGRFRQFYQAGIEALGTSSPLLDAEIINLLSKSLTSFGIENYLTMEINSIGCPACRPTYREKLINYFNSNKDRLCKDCNNRLHKNPLRILDCKNENCKQVISRAPVILDHLCEECNIHFEKVKEYLHHFNVQYKINPYIVRGLDYYVKTAFEMTTDKLGASSAVGAGGRYDGLVKSLGGPDIAGIGFAIGIDRLVELIKLKHGETTETLDCYIITFPENTALAIKFAENFRKESISTSLSYELGSIKSEMKKANRLNAQTVVIIGEDEVKNNRFTLRDMNTGEQFALLPDQLISKIKEITKK